MYDKPANWMTIFKLESKNKWASSKALERLYNSFKIREKTKTWKYHNDRIAKALKSFIIERKYITSYDLKPAFNILDSFPDNLYLAFIVECLSHSYANIRNAAAITLSDSGWTPTSKEEEVLFKVALGEFRDIHKYGSCAVEPLICAFEGYDTIYSDDYKKTRVKKYAAEALSKIDDTRAIPIFIRALQKESAYLDEDICICAANALGKMSDISACDPLLKLLYATPQEYLSFNLTQSIIDALINLKDTRIKEWAEKQMDWNIDTKRKPIALKVLCHYQHQNAFDICSRIVNDFNYPLDHWVGAVKSLHLLNDNRVIPCLLSIYEKVESAIPGSHGTTESILYTRKSSIEETLHDYGDACLELGLPLCSDAPFMRSILKEIEETLELNTHSISSKSLENLANLKEVWEIKRLNDFTDDPDLSTAVVAIDTIDCAKLAKRAQEILLIRSKN